MWVEYVILKYKLYGTIIIFTKTSILYYLLWILQLSLLKYDDDCQLDQSSIVPLIDGGSEGKPTGISISTFWGHYMYIRCYMCGSMINNAQSPSAYGLQGKSDTDLVLVT